MFISHPVFTYYVTITKSVSSVNDDEMKIILTNSPEKKVSKVKPGEHIHPPWGLGIFFILSVNN